MLRFLPAAVLFLTPPASGQAIPACDAGTKAIKPADSGQPQFFDEPHFIVAGVTDANNRGGHGSDAIVRSSEALTKATAALGHDSPANPTPEAALHHALAEACEHSGHALEAVKEYQRAAELDPTETYIFDWGAELLTHRASDAAVEVFTKGRGVFPRSSRMSLGLAAAWYARRDDDKAARYFFEAADIEPTDPGPYLLLGKVQSNVITESDGFAERMERFARLQPRNAWANYYYAVSLAKRDGDPARIQALLEEAVRLDPSLAAAHVELGVLYANKMELPRAASAFQKAIAVNPNLEEAHYRLAQAYGAMGEQQKAQQEFERHNQLLKEATQQAARERSEMPQFVVTLRDRP